MSAFMVSKAHIDALVQALIAEQIVDLRAADETGRLLWRECLTSVAYRYPNDEDGQRPGPLEFRDADVDAYRFTGIEAPFDDFAVVKANHCYAYQSCEHAAWETSEAKRLCDALDAVVLARLGLTLEQAYNDRRYNPAPWDVGTLLQMLTP